MSMILGQGGQRVFEMTAVASFGNLQYNHSIPPVTESELSELLICSWNYVKNDNVMLTLIINKSALFKIQNIDLYVSDTSRDIPTLRIGINNGAQEIFDAIDRRAIDLLEIIEHHNPDIEEIIGRHPSCEGEEIKSAIMPGIALSASTKRRL